jgi:hypothetical protein
MQAERVKFELGRHETFALREGWLAKGLARLVSRPEGYRGDLETADELGLGSRMAKSLAFWLDGAGFAHREGQKQPLAPTDLARAAAAYDPHFEYPATLWFVHLMLARRPGSVWNWFFNDFPSAPFSRDACVDSFYRTVREQGKNQTTLGVAQREVACLLAAYSAPSAAERPDPEDLTSSPLHGLALVVRHQETGRFEKSSPPDPVPIEAFLACADLLAREAGPHVLHLSELAGLRNSPGRLFNLDGDALAEMAYLSAETFAADGVAISLQGSSRTISLPGLPAEEWLGKHFRRVKGAG